MRTIHRERRGGRERGNALVLALLGLVVTALAAVGVLRERRLEQRRQAGTTEATVLEALRNAVNAAVFEQVVGLQAGSPLSKGGLAVAPVLEDGVPVWRPTPAQLAGMGYLPPGWTAATSILNDAPYALVLRRLPAGCAAAACAIEGQVVLGGSIRSEPAAGTVDAVVIGAILGRIGADAGVSLQVSPEVITGFGHTWSVPNPVAGSPAGVVAVRVGTASAGFSQFVRINDARDPDLAGNLTVAGAVNIGGAATVRAATLTVAGGDGTPCMQVLPAGQVRILCDGGLAARTASFDDGAGNTTSVAAGTLSATGAVSAGGSVAGQQLRPTGSYAPGAPCSDANALAGDASRAGLVLCSGGAWRAVLTQASAGQACAPEGHVAQADGAGLLCRGGAFVALTSFLRRGSAGAECAENGAMAVDIDNRSALLCRPNLAGGSALWYRAQDLASNLQWIGSLQVIDTQVVPKPTCGSSAGYSGQPAVMLTPQAEGSTDASFSRYAVDNGASWTVYLRDSAGNVLQANTTTGSATALAQVYCYYP